jgi:hypothetical protein
LFSLSLPDRYIDLNLHIDKIQKYFFFHFDKDQFIIVGVLIGTCNEMIERVKTIKFFQQINIIRYGKISLPSRTEEKQCKHIENIRLLNTLPM